jgi:steroid delta-isomerase-like uncharacterized protein
MNQGGLVSEINRGLAIRWFQEVWNERREETIDDLFPEGAIGHMEGAEIRGPSEFRRVRATLLAAFPDLRVSVEETLAEGDIVVVRWSARATHLGDALGFAASRRPARFRGMTWLRFAGGKITEGWDAWNQGALLEQLRPGNPPSN